MIKARFFCACALLLSILQFHFLSTAHAKDLCNCEVGPAQYEGKEIFDFPSRICDVWKVCSPRALCSNYPADPALSGFFGVMTTELRNCIEFHGPIYGAE